MCTCFIERHCNVHVLSRIQCTCTLHIPFTSILPLFLPLSPPPPSLPPLSLPLFSPVISSASSEHPSLLSSCSSGSLGGNDTPDEVGGATSNVSTSSEVTSGGKVFVVKKQSSMESCDGPVNKTPPSIHVPVIRKTVSKKNGDIRASLTEEIFANEINAQHSGELQCTCTYTCSGTLYCWHQLNSLIYSTCTCTCSWSRGFLSFVYHNWYARKWSYLSGVLIFKAICSEGFHCNNIVGNKPAHVHETCTRIRTWFVHVQFRSYM